MIWAAACRAEHFSSKESRNDEGRLVPLVVDEDDMLLMVSFDDGTSCQDIKFMNI